MNTRQLLTDKLPADIVDHVIMPYVQNTKEQNKRLMNKVIHDIQTYGTRWNAVSDELRQEYCEMIGLVFLLSGGFQHQNP